MKLFSVQIFPHGLNREGHTNFCVRAEDEDDARWQIGNLISDILTGFTQEQLEKEDMAKTKRIIVRETKIPVPC